MVTHFGRPLLKAGNYALPDTNLNANERTIMAEQSIEQLVDALGPVLDVTGNSLRAELKNTTENAYVTG